MKYPTAHLTTLSDNARLLYGSARTSLQLDRDWLKPGAHRMSAHAFDESRKLDPEFTPSDELLAAVGELVDAGYAWHSHSSQYGMLRVDPRHYTVAKGDGPWVVTISRVTRPGLTPFQDEDGALIAVLDGAELLTRSDRGTERDLNLSVVVPGARDVEHDPAYAANITLQLPTFPQIHGRRMTFWGIAQAVHLYPLGTDPRLLDDRTHEALDAPVQCTSEYCQGGEKGREPHVFAPYLPPAVDLQRSVLCIEAYIRKPQTKKKRRTSA